LRTRIRIALARLESTLVRARRQMLLILPVVKVAQLRTRKFG
jgi:hypothetical protein